MAPSDDRWMLPENLRRQEREDIARVQRGEDGSQGDFGSYYALLSGRNADWAGLHAVADEGYLCSYVRQLRALLGGLATGSSALDVGCGPGVLTSRIQTALGCDMLGIDVSVSAIDYARRSHPSCRFENVGVEDCTNLVRRFDLVHARELYPFTRTGNPAFHERFLKVLARHVAPGGRLVLALAATPDSLASAVPEASRVLQATGMSAFWRVSIAHAKLLPWLPLPIARAATVVAHQLAGRPTVHFYLSVR